MPVMQRVRLHDVNAALWPAHKSLEAVLDLKATTPSYIWQTTYQGHPSSPSGDIFLREWWEGKNRFHTHGSNVYGYWLSCDTALSDKETAAKSAIVVGELTMDFVMRIVDVWADHVQYPQLTDAITGVARRYREKLVGVIIEGKVSGISVIQTLRQLSEPWLSEKIVAFNPKMAKELRYNHVALYCKQDCVELPYPSGAYPWLFDLENDLYSAPNPRYKDVLDSFAQLLIFTEKALKMGFQKRRGGH